MKIHHFENTEKHNKKTKDFDDHLDKMTNEQIKDMNQELEKLFKLLLEE